MLWRNSVVSPVNGAFKLRPKAFNSIGMNVTTPKLTSTVANCFVNMSKRLNFVVAIRFIGSDNGIGRNHFNKQWDKCSLLNIWNYNRFNFPLALNRTEYRSFTSSSATTLSFANTANIGLISFNDFIPIKRIIVLLHKKANLFRNSPSAFVGYSKLSLKFFSCYSIFTLANQIDCMKPQYKRGRAFMKDSSFSRVNLKPTRTSVRSAVTYWSKAGLSAFLATKSVGKSVLKMCAKQALSSGKSFLKSLMVYLMLKEYQISHLSSRDSYLNFL